MRENEQNKILSYSYWSGFSGLEDKPENYSLVTYTLESSDDKKQNSRGPKKVTLMKIPTNIHKAV